MKNNNRNMSYAWIIWGLGAAYFFLEYLARVAPAVMVPELMKAFQVNALSLGSLSAFFYYAYIIMQVPVGALMDRFSPRRLLTIMAALCGVSCFLFAAADSLALAQLTRFFMGFSASFAFIGTLKIDNISFPPYRLGFLAGCTQGLGMLGAAVGSYTMALSVSHMGWRWTMVLVGGSLVILAILIAIIIRDPQNQSAGETHVSSTKDLWPGFVEVLRNSQSWLNALYAGLIYAPTAAFAELWGISYLKRIYGLSTTTAAAVIGSIFIGWVVGGPLVGFISDRIKQRRPVMIVSGLASLIFMTIALYVPNLPLVVLVGCLFLYGVSNAGVAIAYTVSGEINPRPVAGMSMAFANMASVIVGAAFQPIIGWLLDILWDNQIENGIRIYSAHAFKLAVLVLPICLFLGFLVSFLVKESYQRNISNMNGKI
jgi:MFS family permease